MTNLSDLVIEAIKTSLVKGVKVKELADRYQVSRHTIGRIKRGKSYKHVKDIPLSEDQSKYQADWGREECIAELRRIAEAHPERVITRNFFRNNAVCSESTWNRYFGTFREFKAAAEITLSRHAKQLEAAIAKHASVDPMRQMNLEKATYAGKYKRSRRGRWKTALIGSDFHDIWCDPFHWRVFVEAARRLQPDVVVLGGDLFDLPEFGKYTVDPRSWNPVARFLHVHKMLRELRSAAPDAQIDLLEGNHEFRLLRHLSEATPALKMILGDLHGLTVGGLFQLDQFEVNYHGPADLAVFGPRDMNEELQKNYIVLWDAVCVHHFPQGYDLGIPGCHGHHHHHLVRRHYSQKYGTSEWHQLGCGHVRRAEYCNGAKWSNGFLITHVDTQSSQTNFEYVEVKDMAVLGGEFYYRKVGERCIL